jgi:hypothetical protein
LIYIFTRDRLKYLLAVWAALVLICILGSEMNEASGGKALLSLPQPNFYNEMLEILHAGKGTLPAFTLGGIILSILSARYTHLPAGKKVAAGATTASILLLAGITSHHFWIVSKLSETPTWLIYISALAVALYTLILILVEKGKAHWFNPIKPIGTATLTAYLIPYAVYSIRSLTGILLPDWFAHGAASLVNCLCFAFMISGLTKLLSLIPIKLKI